MSSSTSTIELLPILPLRNLVMFPMAVVPVDIGREKSVRLIEEMMSSGKNTFGVLAQKNADVSDPSWEDCHRIGTVVRIAKLIQLGEGSYSAVLNGLGRFELVEGTAVEPFHEAKVRRLRSIQADSSDEATLNSEMALLKTVSEELLQLNPLVSRELQSILENVREAGALADLVAANLRPAGLNISQLQEILETPAILERLLLVRKAVQDCLHRHKTKQKVGQEVREELVRDQRELALRQQMRAILEELGEADDEDELFLLREKAAANTLPEEVSETLKKQFSRLRNMQSQSSEYQTTRNYVEWLVDLPWMLSSPDIAEVKRVRQCLDEDHFGLETVKKRIVEFSAVRQLRKDKRGPILLFVGPPGVGKTSLGRSIARATGRRYERIALGGVRDEAEIRGHRRTYVSSLPGRIIQAIKKTGNKNPVLVLDEIEKMGADHRGDPAAALLEVLDPAQNDSFVDHYLGLPFDLSEVLFIATANSVRGIPGPLLDRLEVIEVPGYTSEEKRRIAEQHLVPKQLRDHGLSAEQLEFTTDGLDFIIEHYTREAGVRGLEREIGSICRYRAVKLVEENLNALLSTSSELIVSALGQPRFESEVREAEVRPGIALGLCSSGVGGDLLLVEVSTMPGKGKVHITGNLRSVMKESAETAVSYVRSRADRLGLDPLWLEKIDLHLHIPGARGAADAAGVGLTIFVAVCSLLTKLPTFSDVATIGELTLRGKILETLELKDKLLAAHRAGIRKVVLPEANRRELSELPITVVEGLELVFVEKMDQVLEQVLDTSSLTQPSATA